MINRIKLLAIALFVVALSASATDKIINAADYGLSTEGDAVPALRSALEACEAQGATKLIIPKGTYD